MRSRVVRTIGLAGLLAGCSYEAGSFRFMHAQHFSADRATVGCLDVGVEPARTSTARRAVLSVTLGNRCEYNVQVHWGNLVGRAPDVDAVGAPGRSSGWLRLELARAPWAGVHSLAANWVAHEIIALELTGKSRELDEVCVDVARLDPTAGGEHWVCVPTEGAL
jgi:hypothetical protein